MKISVFNVIIYLFQFFRPLRAEEKLPVATHRSPTSAPNKTIENETKETKKKKEKSEKEEKKSKKEDKKEKKSSSKKEKKSKGDTNNNNMDLLTSNDNQTRTENEYNELLSPEHESKPIVQNLSNTNLNSENNVRNSNKCSRLKVNNTFFIYRKTVAITIVADMMI